MAFVYRAIDPVEHVKEAIQAERYEVEGAYDGGDGGLAEEDKLGNYAHGFENLGEDPEELERVSLYRKKQAKSNIPSKTPSPATGWFSGKSTTKMAK